MHDPWNGGLAGFLLSSRTHHPILLSVLILSALVVLKKELQNLRVKAYQAHIFKTHSPSDVPSPMPSPPPSFLPSILPTYAPTILPAPGPSLPPLPLPTLVIFFYIFIFFVYHTPQTHVYLYILETDSYASAIGPPDADPELDPQSAPNTKTFNAPNHATTQACDPYNREKRLRFEAKSSGWRCSRSHATRFYVHDILERSRPKLQGSSKVLPQSHGAL